MTEANVSMANEKNGGWKLGVLKHLPLHHTNDVTWQSSGDRMCHLDPQAVGSTRIYENQAEKIAIPLLQYDSHRC